MTLIDSGAQGEYTGLRTIRQYYEHHGQGHRNVSAQLKIL